MYTVRCTSLHIATTAPQHGAVLLRGMPVLALVQGRENLRSFQELRWSGSRFHHPVWKYVRPWGAHEIPYEPGVDLCGMTRHALGPFPFHVFSPVTDRSEGTITWHPWDRAGQDGEVDAQGWPDAESGSVKVMKQCERHCRANTLKHTHIFCVGGKGGRVRCWVVRCVRHNTSGFFCYVDRPTSCLSGTRMGRMSCYR